MARKFPYTHSGGPLIRTIEQLRKSFPEPFDSNTMQKLGLAPNNESYVLNVLRFLGVIDEAGKRVAAKAKAFAQHKNEAFEKEFEQLVKDAYKDLFDLHGDSAWALEKDDLTQFFRASDSSSDVVGRRQASTFRALSSLAGHAETPVVREIPDGGGRPRSPARRKKAPAKPAGSSSQAKPAPPPASGPARDLGLTVRIEVNLPADGDQATYDRIFKSIRKNLIEGE